VQTYLLNSSRFSCQHQFPFNACYPLLYKITRFARSFSKLVCFLNKIIVIINNSKCSSILVYSCLSSCQPFGTSSALHYTNCIASCFENSVKWTSQDGRITQSYATVHVLQMRKNALEDNIMYIKNHVCNYFRSMYYTHIMIMRHMPTERLSWVNLVEWF